MKICENCENALIGKDEQMGCEHMFDCLTENGKYYKEKLNVSVINNSDCALFGKCGFVDSNYPECWKKCNHFKIKQPKFKAGDKVIKNEETWIPNDFDGWGRGVGVGIVVEPPFELEEGEVDVKWPNGRCFEFTHQLKKQN